MGERGPVPKRSSQRRRQNREAAPEKVEVPVEAPAAAAKADAPAPNERWHPAARAWYESLARSGQSTFYEASDWALAYLIAESISRDLKPQVVGVNEESGEPVMAVIPMKGASLSAYLKAMTALLVTEGDRRRARIELERAGAEPSCDGAGDKPGVSYLDAYRDRAAG